MEMSHIALNLVLECDLSEQIKILRRNAQIMRENDVGLEQRLQQQRWLLQQTQYQLEMCEHQRHIMDATLQRAMQQHEDSKNKVAVLQHELQDQKQRGQDMAAELQQTKGKVSALQQEFLVCLLVISWCK